MPGVRRRDRVVPGAPQTAVLVVAAAAARLAADPRRAARRVPVVRRVRGARDRRAPRPRTRCWARPGQPPVPVRAVPPPHHRDRGRVAVGAVIFVAGIGSVILGHRGGFAWPRRTLHGSSCPLIERRLPKKAKTWVTNYGASRYPLQATTLRGTPHPPLAARRPALAAVRCQAGRGRVHRCAGGPRRPDPPAALSGPRSAPPPWRRCWTTRSGGPCGCRVTRLPWQLPGRAAGAVQLATPCRVAWIGRAESAAGVGATRARGSAGLSAGRSAGPRSEPRVRGRMVRTMCRGPRSDAGVMGAGSDGRGPKPGSP